MFADDTVFADNVLADDTVIADDELFVDDTELSDDTALLAVIIPLAGGSSLPTGDVMETGLSLLLTGASPPAPVATSL